MSLLELLIAAKKRVVKISTNEKLEFKSHVEYKEKINLI